MFDANIRVLTAKGGSQQIPPTLYDYVCLTSDKKLYYNEAYANNLHVLNKIAYFKEAKLYDGLPIPVSSVEMRSFYDKSLKSSNESSQTQREIQDLFEKAATLEASDVHITVRQNECLIKFRRIGDLELVEPYTADHGHAICKTIFMTMCDQSGKTFQPNTPQEARMKAMYLPDGITGVRIQTSKTDAGYIMVCRLLKRIDQSTMTLEKLGYERFQILQVDKAKSKQAGINIFAGPTGSGKSSSLASILSRIMEEFNGRKHIVTVENPVEYAIGGVTTIFKEEVENNLLIKLQDFYQARKADKSSVPNLLPSDLAKIQNILTSRIFIKWQSLLDNLRKQEYKKINLAELESLLSFQPFQARAKYSEKKTISYATQTPVMAGNARRKKEKFSESMSAMMRLDPDVIMIGEIRDAGSLKAASDASMTGHQVWTTVHATTAPGIVKRLLTVAGDADEKVEKDFICDATIISSLIAQKLIKKLCPHCSVPFNPDLIEPDLLTRLNKVLNNELSGLRLKGDGCPKCANTGNTGRTVVAEIIVTNQVFMEKIRTSTYDAENYWIKELDGMTMMMHGLLKVKRGEVDPIDLEEELEQIDMNPAWQSRMDEILTKYLQKDGLDA
jgi:type II secretory ATPase GspE/PulE/Tfp pilus assembly ATPase PilB-like protein